MEQPWPVHSSSWNSLRPAGWEDLLSGMFALVGGHQEKQRFSPKERCGITRSKIWNPVTCPCRSGYVYGLSPFSRSVVSDSLRPHGLQHARPPCSSPTPGVYSSPLASVMPSNHLILCRPLLLLPSIFPSIRVFSSESVLCIRWPKYWSFSFSISPSNAYSGLISV